MEAPGRLHALAWTACTFKTARIEHEPPGIGALPPWHGYCCKCSADPTKGVSSNLLSLDWFGLDNGVQSQRKLLGLDASFFGDAH
jgi:hypothetical protein